MLISLDEDTIIELDEILYVEPSTSRTGYPYKATLKDTETIIHLTYKRFSNLQEAVNKLAKLKGL